MSDATVIEETRAIDPPKASPWPERFERLEGWLANLSDYLNPILVKETRQALKSRQFGLVFVLLLIVCWVITIFNMAVIGPGVYYAAVGRFVLSCYYVVMVFPLVVVVPFSAFRSLSGEREENTYDLLRVSTLTPHQIVQGKLASAAVQDGVYLSAIAPCIAFTYLLRGVDVLTIGMVLLFSTLGSLGLSMIGLFLAALSPKKQGQVLLSVLFVSGLLFSLGGAISAGLEFLSRGQAMNNDFVWPFIIGFLSFYATTFALIYLATVALISSNSHNRSSPLRWAMVVQQAVFVALIAYAWMMDGFPDEALVALFMVALVYWYLMGTMLTTESANLSHRVRRNLPQSVAGRMMRGLFNPGPATGFFFAIANLTAIICLVVLAMGSYDVLYESRGRVDTEQISLLMIVMGSMMVIYLGVGKLIVAALNRFAAITTLAGFLIHVLLVLAGAGIPLVVQNSVQGWNRMGYNPMQWLNPFWTVDEYVDGFGANAEHYTQAIVMLGLAFCVLLSNLPGVTRELMQGRVALPTRVAQDEEELHPVQVQPQSPWDDKSSSS